MKGRKRLYKAGTQSGFAIAEMTSFLKGTVQPKIKNLFTLISFQTCMTFFCILKPKPFGDIDVKLDNEESQCAKFENVRFSANNNLYLRLFLT